MARNALIQVRRDTAANWTSVNPTLAAGEIGYESNTGLFKIGDGSTAWASLGYSAVTTTSTSTLTNKTLTSPEETWSVSPTAATGTMNIDVVTSAAVLWTSNTSANWVFNFRGNSTTTLSSILPVGSAVTVAIGATNGVTARYPTSFRIDGNSITPKWQNGIAPGAGNANSIDVYTFTIIKTDATPTYTVFASQTKFA